MLHTIIDDWHYFVWLVANLAAGVGVGVALLLGLRESRRWRHQAQATKRAEIAGEVHGATVRFIGATLHATSQWHSAAPAPSQEDSEVTAEHQSKGANYANTLISRYEPRWTELEPLQRAFLDATDRASVYLPKHVSTLIDRVWIAKQQVQHNQSMFITMLRNGVTNERFFDGGWGIQVQNELLELRQRVFDEVGPLMRLEDTRQPRQPRVKHWWKPWTWRS